MFSQLIAMATRALSDRNGSPAGAGGQRTSGRSQMIQKVGSEAVNQVRKAGPDAAQRHLSKTKFGADPRAQKAARAADDLARRFAGTGSDTGSGTGSGNQPGGAVGGAESDRRTGSGPARR